MEYIYINIHTCDSMYIYVQSKSKNIKSTTRTSQLIFNKISGKKLHMLTMDFCFKELAPLTRRHILLIVLRLLGILERCIQEELTCDNPNW